MTKIIFHPLLLHLEDITEHCRDIPAPIKAVYELHVYSPLLAVHICSFTPSAEMYFLQHVFEYHRDWDMTEEESNAIEQFELAISIGQPSVDYYSFPHEGYFMWDYQVEHFLADDFGDDFGDALMALGFDEDLGVFDIRELTREQVWQVMNLYRRTFLEMNGCNGDELWVSGGVLQRSWSPPQRMRTHEAQEWYVSAITKGEQKQNGNT